MTGATQIDGILAEMEAYAVQNRVPIIGAEGVAVLTEAVRTKQPRFILELGTAIGYSTLLIAVNAPQAQIMTIEHNAERLEQAARWLKKAGIGGRVQFLCGDAGLILPTLPGKYDLVFLDAAKGQYLDYLQKLLGKLEAEAVVIADNVHFRGYVNGEAAIPRRFRTIARRLGEYIEFVCRDPRFHTCIQPAGDGMTISYYKGVIHENET